MKYLEAIIVKSKTLHVFVDGNSFGDQIVIVKDFHDNVVYTETNTEGNWGQFNMSDLAKQLTLSL